MTPMNHFQLDIFATMRQSEKEEKLGREILSFLYLSFLDCSAVYFLPWPNSVWVRRKIFFNVRIFNLCNPFTRNGPNAFYRLQYCLYESIYTSDQDKSVHAFAGPV